jgi:hypothetical protein
MNDKMKEESPRIRGSWPAWEQEAEQILTSIRTHVFQPNAIGIVALGQAVVMRGDKSNSDVALHSFLRILDMFLSQLIHWVEQTDPPNRELRKWAGEALANRSQFLLAQQRDWQDTNEGFRKRRAEFGDRRHARLPRSHIAWVAGDYLDALIRERGAACLLLSPPRGDENGGYFAQILGYSAEQVSWLKKVVALPAFCEDSAHEWADVVFERMQKDEQKILSSPPMRECNSRDSRERRGSGEVRLYDFKKTIVEAVVRLASRPVGYIRGLTRPA